MSETGSDTNQPQRPKSPLESLTGDVGCVMMSIPIGVCFVSYLIFTSATVAGAPWAGAAAVGALSAMAFGIFFIALRSGAKPREPSHEGTSQTAKQRAEIAGLQDEVDRLRAALGQRESLPPTDIKI